MSAHPDTAAPTGRKKPVPRRRGKDPAPAGDAALGHASQNTSSPDGEKEGGSRYHVQLPKLPTLWSYQRFEKILDVQGGSQPPKSTFVYEPTPGYIQLLQIRDFGERGVPTYVREDSVTKRCTEDDVLIARYGASLGRIVTGETGAYNVALAKVIFDREQFFNRYLFYLLKTPFFQTPIHMISRSAQNGFNKGDLSHILLPVAPLPEQRRIVAEIEKQFTRLEAGVAALRRVQANLKRYRAAVLKAACEGRLEIVAAASRRGPAAKQSRDGSATFETGAALLARILTERRQNWKGRGQYKEPTVPDTTNLPTLPEGWAWASIEQLLRESLCNGVSVKGSDNPPGVRALRLSAMSNSGFDYSDARYLPLNESDVDDLWIQEGDFFMSRGNGSLHLVGRGTAAQKPPQPTIFPDTMIRLRMADPVRKSGWVSTLWPSRIVRSQIETRVKTTAGIYKIAQPQVEGMVIPLPPLAEQTRIVAEVERRLSVVEELESVVTANLQRATRLRQSILQKAFTGELKS